MLDQARLHQLLHYDPETGVFVWRALANGAQRCGRVAVGDVAGAARTDGRKTISVDGKRYLTSRLAWLWMTGTEPDALIDHRDDDPSNDRWSNLRLATHAENMRNSRKSRSNSTGMKGVTVEPATGKFKAQITVDRKNHHLGTFDTAEAAHGAYATAATRHHGEFARIA